MAGLVASSKASSCPMAAAAPGQGGLAPSELRLLQQHRPRPQTRHPRATKASGVSAQPEQEEHKKKKVPKMGMGSNRHPQGSTAVDCSCGVFLLRPHVLRLARAGGAAQRRRRKLRPSAALALESDPAAASGRVELAMVVGVEVIPHPSKVQKGGEDAYFVSDYDGGMLGVADGVSGWAEENVDPALFSRELMSHAANLVSSGMIVKDPRALLAKAHQSTRSIGAATACVAILERKGILHIANLGDSGLRLVRSGRVVFATTPQQHYFDCPYQLSSESGAQTAADATVHHLPVREGDTIVLGSDGLFDNVYNRTIEHIVVNNGGKDQESAQRTAKLLGEIASRHSRDDKYESPYTREAISQGYDVPLWKKIMGHKLTGGKLDDITVLVAHVVDAKTLPQKEIPGLEDSFDISPAFSDGGTNDSSLDSSSFGSVCVDSPRIDSPTSQEVISREQPSIQPEG